MAVAAALLSYCDASHIGAAFCHFDCLDWRFVTSWFLAGRIDPTERNSRPRMTVGDDCVRLDASRDFRAGSVCVCP